MDNIESSNDSFFTHLPLEISILILKQLDSKDLSNLCLTCRKWYETVHSLPESMKHITKSVLKIRMTTDGFLGTNDELIFTPLSRISWIKKLKIEQFYLMTHTTGSCKFTVKELLKFLDEYRLKFEIEWFHVRMGFEEDDLSIIYGIFDLAKNVEVDCSLLPAVCGRTRFLTERRLFHSLECKDHIELDTINQILKQWVRGERENLNWMELQLHRANLMGIRADIPKMFESLTQGLEEHVERHEDIRIRTFHFRRYACDFDLFSSTQKRANIKFDDFVFRFFML